jgi:hypothetical protein
MRISRRAVAIAGAALLVALAPSASRSYTLDLNQFVGPVLARSRRDRARDHRGRQRRSSHRSQAADRRGDVRLANAPWGKAPYFVTAKRLEMQVALLPLLSGSSSSSGSTSSSR